MVTCFKCGDYHDETYKPFRAAYAGGGLGQCPSLYSMNILTKMAGDFTGCQFLLMRHQSWHQDGLTINLDKVTVEMKHYNL
jgi:hypothetical protein